MTKYELLEKQKMSAIKKALKTNDADLKVFYLAVAKVLEIRQRNLTIGECECIDQ